MANSYEKGDLVRCTGTFTDTDGDAQDPGSVFFKYKNPIGTTTTLTYGVDGALIKSATGIYYTDVNANIEGDWYYRFESTGTGQAANESYFTVSKSVFT